MKKLIYLFIALLVVGGLTFALTQTRLLQGWVPGKSYVIKVEVNDPTGIFMSGLTEDNFYTGSKLLKVWETTSNYYRLTVEDSGSQEVSVWVDGYLMNINEFTAQANREASVNSISLEYGHMIFLEDENGAAIDAATVKAGPDSTSLTDCTNFSSGNYGCVIPASSSNLGLYTIEMAGYESMSASFETVYTSASTTTVTAYVILYATSDTDGDGLTDDDETDLYGTDRMNPDTDGDGLMDGEEIFTTITDPLDPDTDNDGLTDGEEVLTHGTDPMNPDTDGGTVLDGDEVLVNGTDPLDPSDDVVSDYYCSSLDLSPNTYALTTTGENVSFAAVLTAGSGDWTGTVAFLTTGSGSFSNDLNFETGSYIEVDVSGTNPIINLIYTGGISGDVITAYVMAKENCVDTLTLTTASDEAVDSDEGGVSDEKEEEYGTDPEDASDDEELQEDILSDPDYECSDSFVDTDGHWAEDIICRLNEAEILLGKDYLHAAPEDDTTRAEMVALLVRSFYEEELDDLSTAFQDLYILDWFYELVTTAEYIDTVRVRDFGDLFNPNIAITRCDTVVYAARILDLSRDVDEDEDIPFDDLDTSDYCTYAALLFNETIVEVPEDGESVEMPIIEGYEDDDFKPHETMTRAEASAFITRLLLAQYQDVLE